MLRMDMTLLPDPRATSASTHATSSGISLHKIFKENHDMVWRMLRRFGVSEDRADDATQHVFLVFAERIAQINPGSERAFLFGTALRTAQTIRRDNRREMTGDVELLSSMVPAVDELTDQKRARQMLDLVLEQLDGELKAVFVLYELEGFTTPEVAEILDVPLGTAASRLRRARERFSALAHRLMPRHREERG